MKTLFCRNGRGDSLTVAGRVVAPAQGIDECLSLTVEDGVITRIEPAAASEIVVAPAFVDPHVHLRTPGREDEETIASGTQAAAAGGYCAILAMPNTEPVVDSASVLGALVERAQDEAVIPTGFMAAISKGQEGGELTEMAELADVGAAAFTDDGRPVVSAGLLRRALQYSGLTGRPLALHCEDPDLSRGGHAHEGAVAAELGLGGYPSVAESVMVERDLALAEFEARPLHVMHMSALESVAALRAAQAAGVRATGEVTPHHLCLTDEALRSLDPNVKMNPPLRSEDDRRALVEALRDGTIAAVATDHAPHALHEKEVPFEEAPFGVTGLETAFSALYTYLVASGVLALETLLERMSAGPARALGLPEPRIEVGARANLVQLDLDAEWLVDAESFRSRSRELVAPRTDAHGARRAHRRGRPGGVRAVNFAAQSHKVGYLVLEDGTVFRGKSVAADGVAFGEAVFTTAMTGYQETVTDPSYAEQLVCFTAPMVGNYGVADERNESHGPHARAAIMRAARRAGLGRMAGAHGLVGLEDVDTRALVLKLRDGGAMRAAAVADEEELPVADALEQVRAQPLMEGQALVAAVSAKEPYSLGDPDGVRVAVVDYGTKRSILAATRARGRVRDRLPAHRRCRRARRLRRRRPLERARRPRAPGGRGRDGPRPARANADPRDLPWPSATRARDRPSHVQAPVRPSWREPPGARAQHGPRARDEPEPRLRGRAVRGA